MANDTTNEQIAQINNIKIAYETFGDPNKPALLMIQGAGNSMVSWAAEFCQQLADDGRFVIRYDTRDTGRSTSFEVGNPPYDLRDLADDALALLDFLSIQKAHVLGLSQGSAVTQLLALDHPDRLRSITLVSGTPGGPGHEATDLPPMTDTIAKIFSGEVAPPDPDWNDNESIAHYLVEGERPFAGEGYFDENFFLKTSRKVASRTLNWLRS